MTVPTLFRYAERLPAPGLTPWFASYWEFAVRPGAPPVHHVPPDGCTSILAAVAGPSRGLLLVTGPWLEPLAVPVQPGTRYVGVRLQPGAVATVLGVDPAAFVSRSVPAGPILGGLADRIASALGETADLDAAARILNDIWSGECRRFEVPGSLMADAVQQLMASRGELPIAELAERLGTSERTLLRRFKTATGLTPKQFARIRRLLAAAWQVVDGGVSWGRIAASAGYADQPHLHHDFVGLTGLRPEAFGSRVRSTEHDQVRR